MQGLSRVLPPSSLLPPRLLRAFLLDTVGDDLLDDSIDADLAAEQIARYEFHRPLPRRRRKGFRSGLQLWIDDGLAMRPFRHDVDELSAAVRRVVGPSYEGEIFFDRLPTSQEETLLDAESVKAVKLRTGMNVLVITDLGIGKPPMKPRVTPNQWLSFAQSAVARGVRLVALVPYAPDRWPRRLRKWVKIVHWHYGRWRPNGSPKERVRLLGRTLSIASQIDPALLREARRRFFPGADAGLEADFLFSTLVSVSNPRVIALRKEIVLELRAELASQPAELQRLFDFLREYRSQASADLRISFEEEMVFHGLRRSRGDRARIRESIARLVRSLVESQDDPSLARWVLSSLSELPGWIRELDMAGYLRTAAELRLGFKAISQKEYP
jgi:hypothetical protein